MLKDHKKLRRRAARNRPGGAKHTCCTPVFVDHPPWGTALAPGPGLPLRWITGIRVRNGQR
jgi:hypothetical protein